MTEPRAAYDVDTKPVIKIDDFLDEELLAELAAGILEICQAGGFGKVVLVVTNRQVEFIEITKRKRRKKALA